MKVFAGVIAVALATGADAVDPTLMHKFIEQAEAQKLERRVLNDPSLGGDEVSESLFGCLRAFVPSDDTNSQKAVTCLERVTAADGSRRRLQVPGQDSMTKESCEAQFDGQGQCMLLMDLTVLVDFSSALNDLTQGTNFTQPECELVNILFSSSGELPPDSAGGSDPTSAAEFKDTIELAESLLVGQVRQCEEIQPGSTTGELTDEEKALVEAKYPGGTGSGGTGSGGTGSGGTGSGGTGSGGTHGAAVAVVASVIVALASFI